MHFSQFPKIEWDSKPLGVQEIDASSTFKIELQSFLLSDGDFERPLSYSDISSGCWGNPIITEKCFVKTPRPVLGYPYLDDRCIKTSNGTDFCVCYVLSAVSG